MANPFLLLARPIALLRATAVPVLATLLGASALASTNLADQPLFSNKAVPGNLALALSVEFPTAISVANFGPYTTTKPFLGYFDPKKCYRYNNAEGVAEADRYFYPVGLASATFTCSGEWSGSFLNWATMQTIDPFRWALTGGYRVKDTPTLTVIEKAWASGQGGTGNFPNRTTSGSALVAGATPLDWDRFRMRIQGLGNKMRFTDDGDVNSPGGDLREYRTGRNDEESVYEVNVRVKVCDPSVVSGNVAASVEPNCKAYGSNWKPEGLIQNYSDRIRYSAFGYLNDSNIQRDGGVLRARQKFVGPTEPRPGLSDAANALKEWSETDGVLIANPDAADATATNSEFAPSIAVAKSGVIGYLNQFGQTHTANGYKTHDPVGELYYAAVRYFKHGSLVAPTWDLGNVPEWTNMTGQTSETKTRWIDGFPVITHWDDPIKYSCQKNYILGIGDVNSHADKNVPGSTSSGNEPSKPTKVTSDPTVDAVAATNKVGTLQGLGGTLGSATNYGGCCSDNSALMAGVAYDSHTKDIRPDDPDVEQTKGKQTITTYWLDVLEFQTYKANNQFFLATKYGGFKVPEGYDPDAATTGPAEELWHTNGETLTGAGGSNKRPDNYFYASRADEMIAGLNSAFASIASDLKAFTTSFSTALPQLTASGNASFSASFDAENWTGELEASELTFSTTTQEPSLTSRWKASAKLSEQLDGTGWNLDRRVITWDGSVGKPFRASGAATVSPAQLALLETTYGAGTDAAEYLNYLRGERSNEAPAGKRYRPRTGLLGDISGSKSMAVGPPSFPYSDATNPGYSNFKTAYAGRPRMVYVGANDGMLHAFNGSLTGADAGREVFAYVPSALFAGPSSPSTPETDGLAALGKSTFEHHFYVDATAEVFDIDLGRTGGPTPGTPDWRSVLIGGLGKGGMSYYALDVTDPASLSSEATVAAKVMWEYPNATVSAEDKARMGFSYGQPVVTKTAKWGWVVVFASGYNNSDGQGYFFFVNPKTGAWLETVSTGVGTVAAPAGMAHAQSHVRNVTDNTADSIYAGDLLGNVWRLDVRQATGDYQAATGSAGAPLGNPARLASLTTAGNVVQPVTTRPLVEIHPRTNKRYILIGTGRLLADTDIADAQPQTFYAIKDGTASAFNLSAPAGVTFPATRSAMVNNSTTLLTGFTADATKPMGWYVDLGSGVGGIGWRMLTDPSSFFGVVSFVSTLPSGNACAPSGNSRVYAADYDTGESAVTTTTTVGGLTVVTPIAYSTAIAGVVTDQKFVSLDGKSVLLGGGNTGAVGRIETKALGNLPLRRLNWRELSTAQ
ncbi:MAG: pilus assembly protein [Methylibium sp.]|uniref:pilus assembly protein n=1 Tax=Methylibium sp. TaxID=2067992 RepID=UPI0017A3BCCF|nr:PilC/PilY family type IV pilus protein [Methylibium sp.]MBA3598219.1 pilus assembly protein [Methylibium sp.]